MTFNWIVTHADLSMHCNHCGKSYKPALPVSMNIYISMCEGFVKDHKDCKPKESHEN